MKSFTTEEDRETNDKILRKVDMRERVKKWAKRMQLKRVNLHIQHGFETNDVRELHIFKRHDGYRVIVEIDKRESCARVYVAVGDQDETAFDEAERMLSNGLLGAQ